MIYQLDPDFRKKPPEDDQTFFCVRCQKAIYDPTTAIQVLVNWDTWEVREIKGSMELMGSSCWRTIKRNSPKEKS